MDDDLSRSRRVQYIRELAARITEMAGHLNAANYRWLTLIAEFESPRLTSQSSRSTPNLSPSKAQFFEALVSQDVARAKVVFGEVRSSPHNLNRIPAYPHTP